MGKIYNVDTTKSLTDFLAERFLFQYKHKPQKLSEILLVYGPSK